MGPHIIQALGGLGLLLLGLTVLTDGLRSLAGDSAHKLLLGFTRSPASGALTGAALTALLQSSSVTTVLTVGFVSAELIAFPRALGIVFGANVGTTATGWLVALFGFKLGIQSFLLPLLLVGMLMRMLGRARLASLGWALAGFAVLFLGIEAMQAGMAAFEGKLTPESFPPDTPGGRVLLVGIGMLVTAVTQSSSAGVAAALTALTAGAITLPQAAAMVIGMDIGTTSTTALATLGGSAAARRTGYAHVIYNLLTGILAFFLLSPYLDGLDALLPGAAQGHPEFALVGFHTALNAVGLVAALPFTGAFARLMMRVVRERTSELVAPLDSTLLSEPSAAAAAARSALRRIAAELFALIQSELDPQPTQRAANTMREQDCSEAIADARQYVRDILAPTGRLTTRSSLEASMHALDHLERLLERAQDSPRREALVLGNDAQGLADLAGQALAVARTALLDESSPSGEPHLRAAANSTSAEQEPYRQRILADVPARRLTLDDALEHLEAIRWLEHVLYHAWRIVFHLEQENVEAAAPETEPRVPPMN